MAKRDTEDLKLGFLATIELPEGGFVGGLLVTNRFGRPLEFQCTTPVRPNRTQEILYGTTLRPYLLGEVIGLTLIQKATIAPDLVLAEAEDLLALRPHISQPVALVDRTTGTVEEPPEREAKLGRQRLRFHQAHSDDGPRFADSAEAVPENADLDEPFERVREALRETTKSVKAG